MQTPVTKDPLRHLRYIRLLFAHEFLHGDGVQRRRFTGRIIRRVSERLGLYTLAESLFATYQSFTVPFQSPEDQVLTKRYRLWNWAISGLNNRDYLKNWLKHRYEGGPKIVVIGMGSVGDLLQITPVLRSLRETLPNADIVLLHRSPAAKAVLEGNTNINSIGLADFYQFEQIKQAIKTEGAADLAIEIQSISYIVTYTRAPKELRHPEMHQSMPDAFFEKAEAALEIWKHHPPVYPRRDEKFSWPEEWKNFHYLDVLGTTGNLPIDRFATLDFKTGPSDESILSRLPKNQPIITVQNGVDTDVMNWAKATGQRATKLLPTSTWKETVRLLRDKGFAVVQLGTKNDETIEGVTLDLRNNTTLREAAVILRHALCHVGIEGGLVHLARAMGSKSVVLFGPTSVAFLGYPQNTNLVASDCTSCWWTTKDWYVFCPRGLKEPECMNAHRAENIVNAVVQCSSGS